MFVVRIIVILVLIAAFVLLISFAVTRDRKYLNTLRQLARYAGWLALLLILGFLISRVIRL